MPVLARAIEPCVWIGFSLKVFKWKKLPKRQA